MLTQKSFEKDLTTLAVLVSLDNKSFGSGIFIANNNEIFFSTARHVLFNEKLNKETKKKSFTVKTKNIELFFYSKKSNFNVQEQISVDLEQLFKAKQLSINSPQDICVFKIAKINEGKVHLENGVVKKSQNLNFNVASSSMVRPYSDIEIGDNLYVIGYPKALGLKNNDQYNFDKPLVRSGIIGGKNDEKQTVIIDCPVFGGNSGGPVFIIEKHLAIKEGKLISTNKKYLIGIVSQFIPWINKTNKSNTHIENSGYGVIVPLDEILKLIHTFSKIDGVS